MLTICYSKEQCVTSSSKPQPEESESVESPSTPTPPTPAPRRSKRATKPPQRLIEEMD